MDATHNLTLTVVVAAHPAVARLAALDESRPPDGPVLLAEVDGLPWAALGLRDGQVVATPFQPSAQLVPLLRARAAQLHGGEHSRRHGRLTNRAADLLDALAGRRVVRD